MGFHGLAALIMQAITDMADRTGSSQMAIERYILNNYPGIDYKRGLLRMTVRRGLESGWLKRAPHHANSCAFFINVFLRFHG